MPELEYIKRIMLERYGEKQKSKEKAVAANLTKEKPNKGLSNGGSHLKSQKVKN